MSKCCGCLGSRRKASQDLAASESRRALHYVLKVDNRKEALTFFTTVLGMKVLRHDEFDTVREATTHIYHAHGPGPNKWSRTMVGYGPEDKHFVLQLIFNYGLRSYITKGELLSIEIRKDNIYPILDAGGTKTEVIRDGVKGLTAITIEYQGYVFKVFEDEGGNCISRVVLAVQDVPRSEHFWMETLGMTKVNESLMFGPHQCKIQFKMMPPVSVADMNHFIGQIGFAAPLSELKLIEAAVNKSTAQSRYSLLSNKYTPMVVKTPVSSLRLSNGESLEIVIIHDADGHEICFFADETYRQYSQPDPNAENLLLKAIQEEVEHPTQNKIGMGEALATRFSNASSY